MNPFIKINTKRLSLDKRNRNYFASFSRNKYLCSFLSNSNPSKTDVPYSKYPCKLTDLLIIPNNIPESSYSKGKFFKALIPSRKNKSPSMSQHYKVRLPSRYMLPYSMMKRAKTKHLESFDSISKFTEMIVCFALL